MDVDITIIGAGVIGLAIAQRVSENYSNIAIVEKNPSFGMETSSRNSEVIHAGIYYPSHFLKTRLGIEGNNHLYKICSKNNIPHKRIGKIIFSNEIEPLEKLLVQGKSNGVQLEPFNKSQIKKYEPNLYATYGIFSPNTGILDTHELMSYYERKAYSQGTTIVYNTEIKEIDQNSEGYEVRLSNKNSRDSFTTKIIINCAGLYAHKIAQKIGINIEQEKYEQQYVKGEYYGITPSKNEIVQHLVYPLPTARGLGIHSVKDISGRLRFGPNAYPVESIKYSVDETCKEEFTAAIQSYLPQINPEDIYPEMSGIRPQLKDPSKRDFIIHHEKDKGFPGIISLIGIESPGITASPAIAEYVLKIIKDEQII